MAITKEFILDLLTSTPENIIVHDDGIFEIEGATDTAGALFDKVEMGDYSWLEAELEDDRGFYRETVFYEMTPQESEAGKGYLISGIYRRNTDVYGHLPVEASFEGVIVETDEATHDQQREKEVARFLDQTIAERMVIVERELNSLASEIKSRSQYRGAGTALDKVKLESFKNLNRTAATILTRQHAS